MLPEIKNRPSPNFNREEIPVEFVVLHYTACTLEDTLALFCTPEKQVCAQFVIDLDGSIYDLGDFWSGPIRKGAHAGKSYFDLNGKRWESFNAFSIGVEIVNFNGNLFSYTQSQYTSLIALTKHLISRFPVLSNPDRIVGHEHIAGFRGKVDPGKCFDWRYFYTEVFSDRNFPKRAAVLSAEIWAEFERMHGQVEKDSMKPKDWSLLSSKLEAFVSDNLKGSA